MHEYPHFSAFDSHPLILIYPYAHSVITPPPPVSLVRSPRLRLYDGDGGNGGTCLTLSAQGRSIQVYRCCSVRYRTPVRRHPRSLVTTKQRPPPRTSLSLFPVPLDTTAQEYTRPRTSFPESLAAFTTTTTTIINPTASPTTSPPTLPQILSPTSPPLSL